MPIFGVDPLRPVFRSRLFKHQSFALGSQRGHRAYLASRVDACHNVAKQLGNCISQRFQKNDWCSSCTRTTKMHLTRNFTTPKLQTLVQQEGMVIEERHLEEWYALSYLNEDKRMIQVLPIFWRRQTNKNHTDRPREKTYSLSLSTPATFDWIFGANGQLCGEILWNRRMDDLLQQLWGYCRKLQFCFFLSIYSISKKVSSLLRVQSFFDRYY